MPLSSSSLASKPAWITYREDRPPYLLDPSRFKVTPWEHQLVGAAKLLEQPYFALFDEMGVGKSKQVIDAACALFELQEVDTMLVVCPAAVKSVWLDPEFGQVVEHAWSPFSLFHFKTRSPELPAPDPTRLLWVVVSYELVRTETRRVQLARQLSGRKVWLVLDESIKVKNHRAEQTRACFQLRSLSCCQRVTLLNGTPIANNLMDLYSQFAILDRRILGYKNFYHFRAVHAVMGGYLAKQVIGFRQVEVVQRRTAPYVLRRLKKDCLDLPPKLPTRLEVTLQPEAWRVYKEMKEEMVAWVQAVEDHVMVAQATTKLLRLAQITSGFIGVGDGTGKTAEVGKEKLNFILEWLKERWDTEPNFRTLVWCRFRPELERLWKHLQHNFPGVTICQLRGGQSTSSREEAKAEFRIAHERPAILLGQPQAGGLGLDFTGCSTAVYMSNDYSLLTRQQSEDRLHRPGQRFPVTYVDVLATGPEGQKTVDHGFLKTFTRKEDLATRTAAAWRQTIMEIIGGDHG